MRRLQYDRYGGPAVMRPAEIAEVEHLGQRATSKWPHRGLGALLEKLDGTLASQRWWASRDGRSLG